MSFNKAKALKTASKYAQQGKYAAAIEEYRKIIQAEPSDITTLNTLGDLHVKVGDKDEAIRCFVRIAEHYRTGGFILKAIAMFKKVNKLDPTNVDIALKLAALYAQQKLMVDARQQYLAVAEHYLRTGQNKQALDIYQKIANLDPENTTIQLRLAEAYVREQQLDQAYDAFVAAAGELQRQQKPEEALHTYLKALKIKPACQLALSSAVNLYIQRGEMPQAVALIQHLLGTRPDDAELLTVLGRVHQAAHDLDAAEQAIARAVVLEPARYQYLLDLASFFIRAGELDRALCQFDRVIETLRDRHEEEKAVALLHEVVARDANHFGALERLAALYAHIREDHNLIETLNTLADAAIRKGEDELAVNALRQLLQLEPDEIKHRRRLRTLGLSDEEVQRLQSPLPAPPEPRPSPAPGSQIPEFEITQATPASARAERSAGELEIPLKTTASHVPLEAPGGESYGGFEVSVAPAEPSYDFSFSEEEMVDGTGSEASLWAPPPGGDGLGFETITPELELSGDLLATDSQNFLESYLAEEDAARTASPAHTAGGKPGAAVSLERNAETAAEAPVSEARLSEEIESIDFYLSQGMLDVARHTLESLAAHFPAHPELKACREKLASAEARIPDTLADIQLPVIGDFSLGAGPHPGPAFQPVGEQWSISFADLTDPAQPEALAEPWLQLDQRDGTLLSKRDGTLLSPARGDHPGLLEREAPGEQEEETIILIPPTAAATADFSLPVESLTGERESEWASAPSAEPALTLPAISLASPAEPGAAERQEAPGSPFGDLLEECDAALFGFEGQEPAESRSPSLLESSVPSLLRPPQPTVTEPPEPSDSAPAGDNELLDILDEFKSGAEASANIEDYETHYHLGLAYKEMEMFGEAIEEFQQAFKAVSSHPSSQNYLLCCSMLGFCFSQKDLPRLAVMWFKKGLDAPGRTEDEYQALRYDLAMAYARLGDLERAYDTFSEVYAIDVNYRGVTEKMREIQEQMTSRQAAR